MPSASLWRTAMFLEIKSAKNMKNCKKQEGKGEKLHPMRAENCRNMEGALPAPLGQTRPPGDGGRDTQRRAKPSRHATKAVNLRGQARPRAASTGHAARTPRGHPTYRPRLEKADHNRQGTTAGPGQRPPRTGRHRPPAVKQRTTNNGGTDTARTAGGVTKKRGGRRLQGRQPE